MAFFNFNQFPDVVSRFFFSFPVSYNKRKHTMLLNFDCWILEKRILSSGQIGVAFIRQCMAFDMPVSLNIDTLLRRCLNKHTGAPPPPPKKKKRKKKRLIEKYITTATTVQFQYCLIIRTWHVGSFLITSSSQLLQKQWDDGLCHSVYLNSITSNECGSLLFHLFFFFRSFKISFLLPL